MRKVLVSEPLVQGEDFFRKDDHQFFSMVWLSIWLNLLIEILFHSLVYLGNFGIYVMYSPHFLACFCRFLSGVYAMEWLEARARSCSPGEEAMGEAVVCGGRHVGGAVGCGERQGGKISFV